MTKIIKRLLILGLALSAGASVAAESVRYVNDYLVITVRSGPGDQYRILSNLHSGDKINVLEESGDFVRITLEDGQEGWVRNQYLVNEPVAKDKLEAALNKLERIVAENQQLKTEMSELKKSQNELSQEKDRLTKENRGLSQENTKIKVLSEKPIALDEENQRLRAESERIGKEIVQLRERNRELEMSSIQKWFMTGGGVLLFGILLGIILPRIGGRRRSSGWA